MQLYEVTMSFLTAYSKSMFNSNYLKHLLMSKLLLGGHTNDKRANHSIVEES